MGLALEPIEAALNAIDEAPGDMNSTEKGIRAALSHNKAAFDFTRETFSDMTLAFKTANETPSNMNPTSDLIDRLFSTDSDLPDRTNSTLNLAGEVSVQNWGPESGIDGVAGGIREGDRPAHDRWSTSTGLK